MATRGQKNGVHTGGTPQDSCRVLHQRLQCIIGAAAALTVEMALHDQTRLSTWGTSGYRESANKIFYLLTGLVQDIYPLCQSKMRAKGMFAKP